MAQPRRNAVLDFIRHLADADTTRFSDQELLDRYTMARDEAAFKAIVRRHGPVVMRVCQGLLRQDADAEDVFQATFMLLARKAGSVKSHLGAWLHKVAHDLALDMRRKHQRQQAHEPRPALRTMPTPLAEVTGQELVAALHEE